jgi:hypothetical protein
MKIHRKAVAIGSLAAAGAGVRRTVVRVASRVVR